MPRESFVYDREKRELIPAEEYYAKQQKGVKRSTAVAAPMVMRDIQPFINVAIDGKEISSRSQKREMLKKHSLVEVGDTRPAQKRRIVKPREAVRASLKRTLQQLGA